MAQGTVERSIENIYDGVFSRAFKSGVKPLQIGRRLLQVVDSERDLDAQGRRVVPNSYLVQMSAADREGFADLEGKACVALRTNPDLRKGKFDIEIRTRDY